MPKISELEAMPRRALNIFYVLDTSQSMQGNSIETLNKAMVDTIEILKEQAKGNADAQLKVSVLQFNGGCEWLNTEGPENAEDFVWKNLIPRATTDVGHALAELCDKLSKDKFLSSSTGSYLPIIIFMTDGYATDNYKKELIKIRENKWFARATKVGFALGYDPDLKMIAEIVGHPEAVISTADLTAFGRLIKFVSQTASMLCSQNHTTTTDITGADVVKSAIEHEDGNTNNIKIGVDNIDLDLPVAVDTNDDWGDLSDWD